MDFFADEAGVHTGSNSAFKGNVGSRSAHQTDKVVVSLRGNSINTQIADSLRESLGGGVKSERYGDMFVLKISVNGLRAPNNDCLSSVLCKVFTEKASISVRVVTTDDAETVEVELSAVFE